MADVKLPPRIAAQIALAQNEELEGGAKFTAHEVQQTRAELQQVWGNGNISRDAADAFLSAVGSNPADAATAAAQKSFQEMIDWVKNQVASTKADCAPPADAASVSTVAPAAGETSGIQWTGLDKLVQKLTAASDEPTVAEMKAFFRSNPELEKTIGSTEFTNGDSAARQRMLEGKRINVGNQTIPLPAGMTGLKDVVNFHADATAKATGKTRVADPEAAADKPKNIEYKWVLSAIEETLNALPPGATQTDVEASLSAALEGKQVPDALANNKGAEPTKTAEYLKELGKEFAANWFASSRPDAAAKADGARAKETIAGWKDQIDKFSETQLDFALRALDRSTDFPGIAGSDLMAAKREDLKDALEFVAPPGFGWDEHDNPVALNRPYDSPFRMHSEFYVVRKAMNDAQSMGS